MGGEQLAARPEPKLRTIPLEAVWKSRTKLIDGLECGWLAAYVSGPAFPELVNTLRMLLPPSIHVQVIRESAKSMLGTTLDRATIRQEAWRLAGNLHRMSQGAPSIPWTAQASYEWVPVEVSERKLHRTTTGKFGGLFSLRVLAGSPAGLVFTKFWTDRFCAFVSRELGFTTQNKDLPYSVMEELVGLRLYVLLKPGEDAASRVLSFEKVAVPDAFKQENRELLKLRLRVGVECPKGYGHSCVVCPLGYDRCPGAVHPRTYRKAQCTGCGKQAWSDPKWAATGLCVACRDSRDRRGNR